jgi:hypothetical protein
MDFQNGIRRFNHEVLPLMEQAGLRDRRLRPAQAGLAAE